MQSAAHAVQNHNDRVHVLIVNRLAQLLQAFVFDHRRRVGVARGQLLHRLLHAGHRVANLLHRRDIRIAFVQPRQQLVQPRHQFVALRRVDVAFRHVGAQRLHHFAQRGDFLALLLRLRRCRRDERPHALHRRLRQQRNRRKHRRQHAARGQRLLRPAHRQRAHVRFFQPVRRIFPLKAAEHAGIAGKFHRGRHAIHPAERVQPRGQPLLRRAIAQRVQRRRQQRPYRQHQRFRPSDRAAEAAPRQRERQPNRQRKQAAHADRAQRGFRGQLFLKRAQRPADFLLHPASPVVHASRAVALSAFSPRLRHGWRSSSARRIPQTDAPRPSWPRPA